MSVDNRAKHNDLFFAILAEPDQTTITTINSGFPIGLHSLTLAVSLEVDTIQVHHDLFISAH